MTVLRMRTGLAIVLKSRVHICAEGNRKIISSFV